MTLQTTAAQADSADFPPLLPAVGQGTSFVDHQSALTGFADPEWYEANVPFVDVPDQTIEDTYYYRWRTFKEALKYTGPKDGWIVSEFLGPVGYAAPGGAISAAAGHHIYEGRWLRDERYLDDYVDYWLKGAGSGAKPANEGLGKDTTDWAHQYSFWVADAVLAKAKVTGRLDEAAALLPELKRQWQAWSPQFNKELGLYWQTPVWDAMEYTASSYQSDDPYHGGDGYRPTLNAYQYGDAVAISELARLVGDDSTADSYALAASNLKAAQEKYLWDANGQFYKHVMRDDNPTQSKIADREEIGFIPWYFHMAPSANDAAWEQLLDPQGFKATYGPTTVERRSPYFMKDAESGCCRWDGPSWPYATSQTLTALGNLLTDYPAQDFVTATDFASLLHDYSATQRKNGKPYVAEAHSPDEDRWMYDGFNHSEDYNHSTFNDIVLSSLIGIRSQDDDTVRIDPQVDSSWDHFAAENVPYHGHNLTVLWDKDGSTYGAGAGLSIYEDGTRIHNQPELGDVTVPFGNASHADEPARQVDDASNPAASGFPQTTASYSWRTDPATEATDGQEFQLDIPSTRWTTYQTPNATDRLRTDFGVPTPVSDIRTVFYSDGGGVRLPDSYEVEYLTTTGDWAALEGQTRTPTVLAAGAVNRITLDTPVVTTSIRLVGTNHPGSGFGVTSFGSWEATDTNISAQLDTRSDGVIAVDPGVVTNVTTTVKVQGSGSGIADEKLYVPDGWTATRTSPSLVGKGAGEYHSVWAVTAPSNVTTTADSPLRYIVASTRPHLVATDIEKASWIFDPESFGAAIWDDDFSTDKLPQYRVSGSLGEEATTAEVNTTAGTLDVSSQSRARGLYRVPVAAGSSFAIIVDPETFAAGDGQENSLFIGSSGGPDDIAMSWFNNNKNQGGVNVVTGGNGHGDAEGAGQKPVSWQSGDRFATVITDGQLTSWIEHANQWSQLGSAPVKVAIPENTLATWKPSFSIRLDNGTISLDRVTVLKENQTAPIPSTVTGQASPRSIAYGSVQKVTVAVSSAAGSPTGTVAVRSGSKTLGTAQLSRGKATITLPKSALRPGTHSLGLVYSGDGTVASATGTTTALVVKAKSKTESRFSHSTVSRKGRPPVLRVTITSGAPVSGTVSVREGTRVLTSTSRIVKGRATLTITRKLSKGTHTLTVIYSGSSTVAGSSDGNEKLRVR